MLRFALALMAAAALVCRADPPSRVTPQMVGTETSYVAMALGGTNNLRAALRWIDSNWPTNIDLNVEYASSDALEDYLLYTNLFDAGVEAGLLASATASTNYLRGTNITDFSYDASTKTWTQVDQPGRLLDWIWLTDNKFRQVDANSSTVTLLSDWTLSASSGAGLLSYDSGYIRVPSNSVAVIYATGVVALDGTNAASSIAQCYGITEGTTVMDALGDLGGLYRFKVAELEGRTHQGLVFNGAVTLVTPSTKYVDLGVYWARSQTGIAGAGQTPRGTTLTMKAARVMLYHAGL